MEELNEYDVYQAKLSQELIAIQKKTFTKWVNSHLVKVNEQIVDLFEDLRDGHLLITLLEIVSGERLLRETTDGDLRLHRLMNMREAFKFLRQKGVPLNTIAPQDIVNGNVKLTMGLLFKIILHFHIADVGSKDNKLTAYQKLIQWVQNVTDNYSNVNIKNFAESWHDGMAFATIIHRYHPELIDLTNKNFNYKSNKEKLEIAFSAAEKLGIARILDPEDVCACLDETSLAIYITSMYKLLERDQNNNIPQTGVQFCV